MKLIMDFLLFVVVIIFFCSLGILFSMIKSLIFRILKKECNDSKEVFNELKNLSEKNIFLYTLFFVVIIFITVITSTEIMYYLGKRDLKDLPYGTYTYYIKMKKVSSGKSYTEPAIITKDSFCYDIDDGHESCEPLYLVERVYFANGGYITFDDENEINLYDYSEVIDHKGNEYEMILLDKHAYIEGVIESHPQFSDMIFVIYLLIIELICWLYPLFLTIKK